MNVRNAICLVTSLLLVAGGCDRKGKQSAEESLRGAARQGHYKRAQRLLAGGTNVNAKDQGGSTPLHGAASRGQMALAGLLIAHGADVHATDKSGRTPLHKAAGGGHRDVAELLLARGADVNGVGRRRSATCTPLHMAAYSSVEMTELLVAREAEIDARDVRGDTPLHVAACLGRTDIVQSLLDHGADPNCVNNRGYTPALRGRP